MTLPGSFGKVTVTGTYTTLTGELAKGKVTFTPDSKTWLTAVPEKVVIVPRTITADLTNGTFAVDLPATDDPDILPNGGTYVVTEVVGTDSRTYSIQVPVGSGPIDLATVAPVQPVTATSRLVTSVNGVKPNGAGNIVLTPASIGAADRAEFDALTTGAGRLSETALRAAFDRRYSPAAPAMGRVCITWDDAWPSWRTVASMADARGQRHTFCVTPGLMPGRIVDADITAWAAAGHEIAAHSQTHANMTQITAAQRLTEITQSRTYLENLIGKPVTTWAYPYGTAGLAGVAGRNPTTDRELYLRYDRMLDTSGFPQAAVHPRARVAPGPFLIRRYAWNEDADFHARAMQLIRFAATNPVTVVLYGHDAAAMITGGQLAEGMDLARSLGVPCITTAEAFPAYPGNLGDPGFEDPSLYHWPKTVSGGGTGIAESVALAGDTNIPGSRVLHLSNPDTGSFVSVSQVSRVEDNRAYSLSFRNKVSIANAGTVGKCYARVRIYDPYFNILSTTFSAPNLTNTGWAQNKVDVAAIAGGTYCEVAFVLESIQAEMWVDHAHWGPTIEGTLG